MAVDALINGNVQVALQLYEGPATSCQECDDIHRTCEFLLRRLFEDPSFDVHTTLGTLLADSGEFHKARRHFGLARAKNDTTALRFREALLIPGVYESLDDLVRTRNRLEREVSALDGHHLDALDHLSMPGTFYVVYMGYNDAALMTKIQNAYARAYPSLRTNFLPAKVERRSTPKLRVGFVSSYFSRHSVCKLFCGVIRGLSEDFEVVVYHAGDSDDEWTGFATERAAEVVTLDRGTLLSNRDRVDVDVLVFTDIGMDTRTLMWASSRLAPVQVLAWGHPHTSGLPDAIDYFVSSDYFGDNNSDAFAEQLVKFDSLSFYFPKPPPQKISFSEKVGDDFYLCPQSLPKFHPLFDEVLLGLFAHNKTVVVTYDPRKRSWMETLGTRLGNPPRLKFIPQVRGARWFSLLKAATLLLDPFPFGGGVTSLEAFSVCKGVVTAPTLQSVPTLTAGMYAHMRLRDPPIAKSVADYLSLALNPSPNLEHQICAANRDPSTSIFETTATVTEWRNFLLKSALR